jgi:hypothetical protein
MGDGGANGFHGGDMQLFWTTNCLCIFAIEEGLD